MYTEVSEHISITAS